MRKKYFIFFCIFTHLWLDTEASAAMKHASASCSPIDSSGYIFLHPYFDGKNWENAYNRVDIVLPDTLCSQKIRPVAFEIGKNINSTMALFSTADGSLFTMAAHFSPYIDPCWDGEVGFDAPKKINLSGISFSAATPFYLIKDSLYNFDSLKVIIGASNQFLLALTINAAAGSISRIDTLPLAPAGTSVRISGEFSSQLMRDTSIWVSGANGMIRSFSYKRTGWSSEVSRNITGLSDTVLCVNGIYAGTNTGKIYKKNASQIFTLDNSSSAKSISAIYPQGAIGKNGNFVELIGSAWRLDTLGAGNYRYANFINRSGGFGVELLDSKWQYSVFTYRDTSAKILLTNPGSVFAYVNGLPRKYPFTNLDTGFTVYFNDPDSNYSNVDFKIKRGNSVFYSLKTNGTDTIRAIPDSPTCAIGAIKLSNGIVNFRITSANITLSAPALKGAINASCGSCYWKKYTYTATRNWNVLDTLIISAGKDYLKIWDTINSPTAVSGILQSEGTIGFSYTQSGHRLIVQGPTAYIREIALFDFRGREIASIQPSLQTVIYLPRSFSSNMLYAKVTFKNGRSVQHIINLLR